MIATISPEQISVQENSGKDTVFMIKEEKMISIESTNSDSSLKYPEGQVTRTRLMFEGQK